MKIFIILLSFGISLLSSPLMANNTDSLATLLENKNLSPNEQFHIHNLIGRELVTMKADSAIYHSRIMLKLTREHGMTDSLPITYRSLGVGFWYLANYDSAMYYYNLGLELAIKMDKPYDIAKAYHNIGITLFKQSDAIGALSNYHKALKYASKAGNEKVIAKINLDLAGAYTVKVMLDSAIYHYKIASAFYEKRNEKKMLIFLYNGMGILSFDMGDYKKSKMYYEKSISLDDEIESIDIRYSNYNNMGRYYEKMVKLDSALYYYEESLKAINYDVNNDSYLSTNINIGIIYYIKKDYHKAIEYNRRVLQIPKLKEYKLEYASVLVNMGIYNIPLKEYDSTEYYFKIALPIAIENEHLTIEKNIYTNRAEMYEIRGMYKEALEARKLGDSIQHIILDAERAQEIRILEQDIRNNATSRENELLKREGELDQELIKKQKLVNGISIAIIVLVIAFLVLVVVNSQKLKRYNSELTNQKLKLEELNTTKDKLFSIISHDLRGPVGSTHSLLKLINENYDKLDKVAIQARLQVLETNSRNVYRQLSNLLDWAKIQRKSIKAELKDLYINDIFKDLNIQLSTSAYRKNIVLQFDNMIEESIKSDSNILKAVISNLIYNSIKFSNIDSKIEITCFKCKTNGICISVKDYGIGIPQELANKLFVLNEETHREGTNHEHGTGLGLIIVKEMIDVLGGSIEVKSKEDEGTEVIVVLNA